jgi:hypothetical protein
MENVKIVHEDATTANGDVLVLKYAQHFYGVDAAVARALEQHHPYSDMTPKPGRYVILPTHGILGVPFVVFVGVVDLSAFDYGQIRSFAYLALQAVSSALPDAKRIVMTVHGPGYGLDEREAFLALSAGIRDALVDGTQPEHLTEIRIAELNRGRAQRLSKVLAATKQVLKDSTSPRARSEASERIDAGFASSRKPHVFVAMPFSGEEMEDVYGFGIQSPVNNAGYLCERIDLTIFVGDILERIRDRIDTSSLVIADLTGANANVYLEVGYAWGRNKSTVLVAKKGSDLKFDIRGQRCLIYANITDLSKKLSVELETLSRR